MKYTTFCVMLTGAMFHPIPWSGLGSSGSLWPRLFIEDEDKADDDDFDQYHDYDVNDNGRVRVYMFAFVYVCV